MEEANSRKSNDSEGSGKFLSTPSDGEIDKKKSVKPSSRDSPKQISQSYSNELYQGTNASKPKRSNVPLLSMSRIFGANTYSRRFTFGMKSNYSSKNQSRNPEDGEMENPMSDTLTNQESAPPLELLDLNLNGVRVNRSAFGIRTRSTTIAENAPSCKTSWCVTMTIAVVAMAFLVAFGVLRIEQSLEGDICGDEVIDAQIRNTIAAEVSAELDKNNGRVELVGTRVDCLPEFAFDGLDENDKVRMSSVTELSFEANGMVSVARHAFNDPILNNIQKLYILENSIFDLPEDTFVEMPNLEELDLSSNGIHELSEAAFKSALNIRKFNMFDNPGLVQIPTVLKNFKNLKWAGFQDCASLIEVENGLFSELEQLEFLDISGTRLIEVYSEREFIETCGLSNRTELKGYSNLP